ncbi:MAG: hypothetical protein KUG65_12530, partial [Sphingomonadaceae bacterium]|nr:hypothetical protein [Sphingomonadaceae bacterium]
DDAAQPLDREAAGHVLAVLGEDPFDHGLLRRLSRQYPDCATQSAIAALDGMAPGDPVIEKVGKLLVKRKARLGRIRRHMRIRAMLEAWLYVHVPATIALIAALLAHIISVFFYW